MIDVNDGEALTRDVNERIEKVNKSKKGKSTFM
jgi:hypothetical protein